MCNLTVILQSRSLICTASLFKYLVCRCQWASGLRRGCAVDRFLGLRVRIPQGTWVSVSCECCQVEVSAMCRSLVQRSPTNCAVLLCVIHKRQEWGGLVRRWAVAPEIIWCTCGRTVEVQWIAACSKRETRSTHTGLIHVLHFKASEMKNWLFGFICGLFNSFVEIYSAECLDNLVNHEMEET